MGRQFLGLQGHDGGCLGISDGVIGDMACLLRSSGMRVGELDCFCDYIAQEEGVIRG